MIKKHYLFQIPLIILTNCLMLILLLLFFSDQVEPQMTLPSKYTSVTGPDRTFGKPKC